MKSEHKIINKYLMATRAIGGNNWRVEANVYEVVRAYLLWNYGEAWLPHIAPYIDTENFPNLYDWYIALSKPNSPYKKVLKVSEKEYKEWVSGLDLTKPVNSAACDLMFEIISSVTKRDVDEVVIAENENNSEI